MPKIDAPTVAEHRAQVQARLIDAAESILREGPSQPLTAAAVSAQAGIARNSIYRYVDSVDDLRELVVRRYLPDWLEAVDAEMAEAVSPEDQIVTWVEANLQQAADTGHGWLMGMAQSMPSNPSIDTTIEKAHGVMRESIANAWRELLGHDEVKTQVAAALTSGLLNAGFRELAADLPAEVVISMARSATVGLVSSLVD
jgi:AcrR family transcriptional regulator